MIDEKLVITVDKGVPVASKGIRGVDPADPRIPQLKALMIGDSFFIADAKGKDARPLVTFAKKIDVILLAREVKVDEIYMTPGVRFWRIEDPKNPQPEPTPEPQPDQVTQESQPDQVEEAEPTTPEPQPEQDLEPADNIDEEDDL